VALKEFVFNYKEKYVVCVPARVLILSQLLLTLGGWLLGDGNWGLKLKVS
jgi:hypothetical protein